ncbi:MAG: hypothetical protein R3D02_00180 [Hyphomicrobiales bacterium]
MRAVRNAGFGFLRLAALAGAVLLAACVSDSTTTGSTGGGRPTIFGGPAGSKPKAAPGAISFEPIVGPPSEAVTVLAASLANHAVTRRLPIVPSGDAGAVYRVKGYLTATPVGGDVEIAYVWDVFDAGERRVSRISGSEKVPASAGAGADPWTMLDPTAADHIAGTAVEGLLALGSAGS